MASILDFSIRIHIAWNTIIACKVHNNLTKHFYEYLIRQTVYRNLKSLNLFGGGGGTQIPYVCSKCIIKHIGLYFSPMVIHALLMIFVGILMCANDSGGSPINATATPEDTNDCSALKDWLAASVVIIIILISLCVALSMLLYMKYRKCQNDVAPGPSATYKPHATGSPTPADPPKV